MIRPTSVAKSLFEAELSAWISALILLVKLNSNALSAFLRSAISVVILLSNKLLASFLSAVSLLKSLVNNISACSRVVDSVANNVLIDVSAPVALLISSEIAVVNSTSFALRVFDSLVIASILPERSKSIKLVNLPSKVLFKFKIWVLISSWSLTSSFTALSCSVVTSRSILFLRFSKFSVSAFTRAASSVSKRE